MFISFIKLIITRNNKKYNINNYPYMIKYTLMFNIGNVQVNSSVTLAPMAGITDLPYRLICKEMLLLS